jgi:protein-S-isoprenylcysteine O-methyltransferase Ste14
MFSSKSHRPFKTVNPLDPRLATQLVTGGVYRNSRNPMYFLDAAVNLPIRPSLPQ